MIFPFFFPTFCVRIFLSDFKVMGPPKGHTNKTLSSKCYIEGRRPVFPVKYTLQFLCRLGMSIMIQAEKEKGSLIWVRFLWTVYHYNRFFLVP